MPSNMHMELIELEANSLLKMKFDEPKLSPNCVGNDWFLPIVTMWTFSSNEKIFPELCLSLRNYVQTRAVIFFHGNDQKQTEVATVQFEELSVAFSYEFNS